jgi:hypothetical protein
MNLFRSFLCIGCHSFEIEAAAVQRGEIKLSSISLLFRACLLSLINIGIVPLFKSSREASTDIAKLTTLHWPDNVLINYQVWQK